MSRIAFAAFCALLLASSQSANCGTPVPEGQEAEESINERDLERHVLMLASDEFEGRKPFTEGERKTVAYIKNEFERMGLVGANNGSYFQDVPLVQIVGTPSQRMTLESDGRALHLDYMDEFVASTRRITRKIDIARSPLVFAGYGIVAPEYGWNDYEGVDVAGKTVLVLVNDPGFATQDESLFRGNAMTYYGRWTYKYEEAARHGATGVVVVHETKAAGYPWSVLQNGAAGADLVLQAGDRNESRCAMEGWVTLGAARRVFEWMGMDFPSLVASAATPGFRAIELPASITLSIDNELEFDTSKNVMAMLPGSKRADECVVYTAHWDHLGIGPAVEGDSIYNGAADNALPVACLLETAEAFAQLKTPPRRSVVFVAVTAEETGLLGSEYYVAHAAFTPAKTVANLNYELFLPLGRMRDVTVFGYGQSELDDYVAEAAKAQGRYVTSEPFPENGMYFRTDHFSFAKAGVPALFFKGWSDQRQHGKGWTSRQIQEYWTTRYHSPNDEYDPRTADLSGLVEDAKLFFEVGLKLCMEETFPQWREGSEFKSIRDRAVPEKGN